MENKWSFTYLLVIVLIFNLQTKIELKSVREVSENENSPNDQTNASLKTQNTTTNPIPVSVQINSTDLQGKKNATETLNQNISLSENGINAPRLNQNNSNSNISNGVSNNSSSTTTTASLLLNNSSSPVNTNTTTTSFSTTTTANTTTTTSPLGHEIKTTKIDEKNDQKEENKEGPNDGNKDDQKEENKEGPNDGNKDDQKEENKEGPNDGNKDDQKEENKEDPNDGNKDDENDDNGKNQLDDKDLDEFAKKDKENSKDKNDNMDPPIKFVDIKNNPPDSNKFPYDNDEESSSGFLTYFLIISGICITAYVVYHNKAKVLGLIIEGRNQTNRRRFNSRVYTRIENVQDAMPNAN